MCKDAKKVVSEVENALKNFKPLVENLRKILLHNTTHHNLCGAMSPGFTVLYKGIERSLDTFQDVLEVYKKIHLEEDAALTEKEEQIANTLALSMLMLDQNEVMEILSGNEKRPFVALAPNDNIH